MTTYLPVTIEQLRNAYTYDAEKDVYYQDIVYNYPYSPLEKWLIINIMQMEL